MKEFVKPKKSLGQHFLNDRNIARKIAVSIPDENLPLLEIGPGTGMLTQFLLERKNRLKVIEIDDESVRYLKQNLKQLNEENILSGDFLRTDLKQLFSGEFGVVGNFPYNISSQILFRVLDIREQVPLLCGMFQLEVAQRITSGHGNKQYGILSVLLQTYYNANLLFTVAENVFTPPPKVRSAVIMLTRKDEKPPVTDHGLFVKIVKAAFNQRRKMLRNSLSTVLSRNISLSCQNLRPEQLSVEDFVNLYLEVKTSLAL